MKKRILALLLIFAMLMTTTGCGFVLRAMQERAKNASQSGTEQGINEPGSASNASAVTQEGAQTVAETYAQRPSLLGTEETILYTPSLTPSVAPYQVNSDFSNVIYAERFRYRFDPTTEYANESSATVRDGLIQNGFVVVSDYGMDEFFDVYEDNRYLQFPNFLTVDSLMHTYHLYFAYLMKKTEKNYLAGALLGVSKKMLDASYAQYEALKGTEWEEAALRNTAFFYIGALLQDTDVVPPVSDQSFSEMVNEELRKIYDAGGIDTSLITGAYEDYSQYKPRGYYEGDVTLEKYFRAMMWYGRIAFEIHEEELLKSALLMTSAMEEAGTDDWEAIYLVTSFFAGASDDPGYYEFRTAAEAAYGEVPDLHRMVSEDQTFLAFADEVARMPLPQVNSVPVTEEENSVVLSFRFMGQRFTIDASIMQALVYKAVKENAQGERRMLPDTLDVAAALGSGVAYRILEEQGATDFPNYDDHLKLARHHFDNSDDTVWNASLYAGWLNTLRPLLTEKGDGYPAYMQSEEWAKKDLETYAGSYAELKHDTILYAKQVMAEMGGGMDEEVLDDRGYVDPEPVVYSRFAFLAQKTKEGLQGFGMLSEENAKDLDTLYQIACQMLAISEKELRAEGLSAEEYEFIRSYGGYLEHFWYEVNKDSVGDSLSYSYQAPCPIIADIATDPNGAVLEVGTGQAQQMYVVFPIDGELHIGSGSVYSFYQFTQPLSDRLTDSEWRDRLTGGHWDDNWNWVPNEDCPTQPDWTQSYRVSN